MNKLILLLMGMFLIGLVTTAVYQTPGAITCDCPEPVVCEEFPTKIGSTNILPPSWITSTSVPVWIVFVVVITLAAIYIQIEFLVKRRRIKKRKGLVPSLRNDALKNMEKAKDISKTPEEFDELITKLGLEEVINKKGGLDKDEPKR